MTNVAVLAIINAALSSGLASVWSWLQMTWAWEVAHPIAGFFYDFWMFCLMFMAYASTQAAKQRGDQVYLIWRAVLAPATVPFLILDATIGRIVIGTLSYGFVAYSKDTILFTGLTNSLIDDKGYKGVVARMWGRVINSICPGHIRAPSA